MRSQRKLPSRIWFYLFIFTGVASAFVLPRVFAGMPIYDPKIGIDDGAYLRPPLEFGLNNLGQAGFLALHGATVVSVLYLNSSAAKIRKAYLWMFYIITGIVIAQSLFQLAGIPFPDSLIRNNPGYAIADFTLSSSGIRNSGPCTEPSVAGAFLVFFACGFFADFLLTGSSTFNAVLALLASALVTSSGSILTLGVMLPLMIFRYFPFRPPWSIDLRQGKRYLWVMALSLFVALPVIAAAFASASMRTLLLQLTVSKGSTGSFLNRTTADLYGLQLLVWTHWLGVGLGSSRSSSLLSTLLSNIGIVGTGAFLIFYIRLFAKLPKQYAWLAWGGFALLFDMAIGVPDITMPLIWVPILMAIRFSGSEEHSSAIQPHSDGLAPTV